MKKFDFNKLPDSETTYGQKNIDTAIREIKENKGIIEVAKRLVDK